MSKHVECGDCKLCFTDYGADYFRCPNCRAPYGRGENGEAVPVTYIPNEWREEQSAPDDSHYKKHVECVNCKTCFPDPTDEWFECPNCFDRYGRDENGDAIPLLFMMYDACHGNDSPDDSHYTKGKIEPWDYIIANGLDFFEGNIVKYVTRWKYKNGIEDLKKVVVYANKLLQIAQDPNRIREKK